MFIVLLLALAALVAFRFDGFAVGGSDSGRAAGSRIVLIDVAKLMNAQRSLASQLIGGDNPAVASTIAQVGNRTLDVIRRVAGTNAIVLVKQAVVTTTGAALPDITAEVLKRLGLPTDVPTVHVPGAAAIRKSTQFGQSQAYTELKRDYQEELAADKAWREQMKEQGNERIIP